MIKVTEDVNWPSREQNKLIKFGGYIVVFVVAVFLGLYWPAKVELELVKEKEQITSLYHGKMLPRVIPAEGCSRTTGYCEEVNLVHGSVTSGLLASLYSWLESNRDTEKPMCFDSPGGSTTDAEVIMSWIHEHNLNTCMADYYQVDGVNIPEDYTAKCSSACPFIMLQGVKRTQIGTSFALEFHNPAYRITPFGYKFGDLWVISYMEIYDVNQPVGPSHALYRGINKSNDMHVELYRKSTQIPNTDIAPLPLDKYEKYSIFTNLIE